MIKKSKKTAIISKTKHILPYFGMFLVILAVVIFGSKNKTTSETGSLKMESLASNNFESVSTDQLSEFYVVASLADSMNLASTDAISSNYVIVTVMNESGQTAANKLEKKEYSDITNVGFRCGVNNYTVSNGESMDSIAEKFGITTDQIRWSNGMKTKDVSAGQTLLVPGIQGIVYKVKAGNTVESLASKYGSDVEKIITCNDLEKNSNLVEGSTIVLPGGSLPETERPEYVAPVVYTYSYTYSGSSNDRQNMRTIATGFYVNSPGNKMVAGQCTWYAWYMRATDSRSLGALPSASLGNAYSWARTLSSYGYRVDRTPEVGAVFQTTAGWYGHVGYVTAVNGDGSITVREMNYGYAAYRVTEAEIPASRVGNFNYIH